MCHSMRCGFMPVVQDEVLLNSSSLSRKLRKSDYGVIFKLYFSCEMILENPPIVWFSQLAAQIYSTSIRIGIRIVQNK